MNPRILPTKMMWPLLDRVGACKRFQILVESLSILSLARSSGRRPGDGYEDMRLKPRFISRYQSIPNEMNLSKLRFNREADLVD